LNVVLKTILCLAPGISDRPPVISAQTPQVDAQLGKNITLTCQGSGEINAGGSGSLIYRWFYTGTLQNSTR